MVEALPGYHNDAVAMKPSKHGEESEDSVRFRCTSRYLDICCTNTSDLMQQHLALKIMAKVRVRTQEGKQEHSQ